ncbi:MAG: NAD(P)-dependent oxidoreductase [Candidatus Curtissbacteria bacterium]|nr:NAD(P)-dependent oxidoreductase [Candidatus Curtissbacteria bacterium]
MNAKGLKQYKIGIVGTGFVARGLMFSLKYHPELELGGVLTRRSISRLDVPAAKKLITHDINKLIKNCDLIVECSGDAVHGTDVAEAVLKAGLPVVTMNPELQITTGSILCQMGTFIEAEGDQPGTIAALDNEVRSMGFKPIVYGNIKRFLNLSPTEEEMEYWSKRQGISMDQVTAFTDGSKVQIEQALVANGLGATIANRGLLGIPCKDLEDGAQRLGEVADEIGKPISDYVLSPTSPAGVFIVAKHDREQQPYLEYLKLGPGPNYVLLKPYHLVHLEILKTLTNVLKGDRSYKFNNGTNPTAQVVAITKRKIEAGETVGRGLGSFDIRGEAVKIENYPDCVPIGLMQDVKFVKTVDEGQIVKFSDVELPKTRALDLWKLILENQKNKSETKKKISRINVSPRSNGKRTPKINFSVTNLRIQNKRKK